MPDAFPLIPDSSQNFPLSPGDATVMVEVMIYGLRVWAKTHQDLDAQIALRDLDPKSTALVIVTRLMNRKPSRKRRATGNPHTISI